MTTETTAKTTHLENFTPADRLEIAGALSSCGSYSAFTAAKNAAADNHREWACRLSHLVLADWGRREEVAMEIIAEAQALDVASEAAEANRLAAEREARLEAQREEREARLEAQREEREAWMAEREEILRPARKAYAAYRAAHPHTSMRGLGRCGWSTSAERAFSEAGVGRAGMAALRDELYPPAQVIADVGGGEYSKVD